MTYVRKVMLAVSIQLHSGDAQEWYWATRQCIAGHLIARHSPEAAHIHERLNPKVRHEIEMRA